MRTFHIFFLLLFPLLSAAQFLSDERRTDWSNAGVNMPFPEIVTEINVKDFGAVGDSLTDDTQPVLNALAAATGDMCRIYFPPGQYRITTTLAPGDSMILAGAGSGQSSLCFDLGGEAKHCIQFARAQSAAFNDTLDLMQKGDSVTLLADDASAFVGARYAEIIMDNGAWDDVPAGWAENAVGQIVEIVALGEDTLTFTPPLRLDYPAGLLPRIRPVAMLQHSGIECLKIVRMDEPLEGAGSNIYFSYAANCRIAGVESHYSVGSHAGVYFSKQIEFFGNYFHEAFTYDGSGTRGYGICLSHHSSEILVHNNIFRKLRHAMIVKAGAQANVFAFNYSREPYRSENIHDASGDISLHGHFPFLNLFEHNIVQNIVIDHYWGPSGPFNTFLRNRAELYGLIMTQPQQTASDSQNFGGQEIPNTDFLHGIWRLSGDNHWLYGNGVQDSTVPPGSGAPSDLSCYLSGAPFFWPEGEEWPSIGLPNTMGEGNIPAFTRYFSSGTKTLCPDSLIACTAKKPPGGIALYPNPVKADALVFLSCQDGEIVVVYDSKGLEITRKTLHGKKPFPIKVPETAGFYILLIHTRDGETRAKKILVQ